jgi:hypothetical protein
MLLPSEVPSAAVGTPHTAARLCMVAARRSRRQSAATVVLVVHWRRGGPEATPLTTERLTSGQTQ